MKRLANRAALVTGGATGLGKAIAMRLAAEGALVAISDIDADQGNRTAQECGFLFLTHNVASETGWDEVMAAIERRFGKIQILVNNAGIVGSGERRTPEALTIDDWRLVFAVNVEGTFLGCKAAISAMREGDGGAIINISSVAALLATPTSAAYGASKAAVRHLTRTLAQYCIEQRLNIRCNSVHPGNVLTDLWVKRAEESAAVSGTSIEAVLAEGRAVMPGGEFVLPEDVAAGVAYLASDDARQVTGEQLVIDGGAVHCDTLFTKRYADLLRANAARGDAA